MFDTNLGGRGVNLWPRTTSERWKYVRKNVYADKYFKKYVFLLHIYNILKKCIPGYQAPSGAYGESNPRPPMPAIFCMLTERATIWATPADHTNKYFATFLC